MLAILNIIFAAFLIVAINIIWPGTGSIVFGIVIFIFFIYEMLEVFHLKVPSRFTSVWLAKDLIFQKDLNIKIRKNTIQLGINIFTKGMYISYGSLHGEKIHYIRIYPPFYKKKGSAT